MQNAKLKILQYKSTDQYHNSQYQNHNINYSKININMEEVFNFDISIIIAISMNSQYQSQNYTVNQQECGRAVEARGIITDNLL